MTVILNKEHCPTLDELACYTGFALFAETGENICKQYRARANIEYSGDKVLEGWNVKLSQGGRTLCRLYPREGSFYFLIVLGRKEKERVENLLPTLSLEMQTLYNRTHEGMGQRWLVGRIHTDDVYYKDLLKLVAIRRQSAAKRKSGGVINADV